MKILSTSPVIAHREFDGKLGYVLEWYTLRDGHSVHHFIELGFDQEAIIHKLAHMLTDMSNLKPIDT